MDSNGIHAGPGPAPAGSNSINGAYLNSGSVKTRARPFTVDEALAYSPLSSVVPFNIGILPLPTVGLQASTSIYSTPERHSRAKQCLDDLNQDAADQQTSWKLESTLLELQELLKPEVVTRFQFKTGPTPSTLNAPTIHHALPKMNLSPFAQMVYENTDVGFRPFTADTPGSQIIKLENGRTPRRTSPVVAKLKTSSPIKRHSQTNFDTHSHNSTIQVVVPIQRDPQHKKSRILTPPKPSPEKKGVPKTTPSLAILLPRASDIIKTEEYVSYPDSPPSPVNLSSKRKRSEVDEDDFLDQAPDQREKADAALRDLQEYLQDIFEAEDQAQPNGVGQWFIITGDDTLSLTTSVQAKTESLIKKVITLGKFSLVALDDLLRLQRLCEGSLRLAVTAEIKVEESWDNSDVEAWLPQLEIAEAGLKSARTSLRLMTAGREEKQLYSEEIIQGSLDAFNNVMNTCLTPIVELRSSGSSSKLFKLLSAEKKTIIGVMTQCRFLLTRLQDLVVRTELSDTVINTLEFAVSRLIFVENAHSEKDSVLGVKVFDSLRVVAMDTLAQIFSSHPTQRQGIFDEILTSLEKLSVNKQGARQFKLAEGGSIQLVSALIMRLVQTSANKSSEGRDERRLKALAALGDVEGDELAKDGPDNNVSGNIHNSRHDTESKAAEEPANSVEQLEAVATPLLETSKSNAHYVVSFITTRAMRSTKTGDAPYRNLLDLFVQDFIACLSSTDWPAAELLLRSFLITMVNLAENDKTAAPAKNMALDVLGEMGAAISLLNSQVRKLAVSFDTIDGDEELGSHLSHLAEAFFKDKLRIEDLIGWTGPYRASLEYLDQRSSNETFLQSAVGYHLASWALQLCANYNDESNNSDDEASGRLAYRLRMMISNKKWLSTEYSFKAVAPTHARLAYSLTLLKSPFCKAFDRVLMILLSSMSSDQATVRSKSLRSVNQVLETDPTILDRSENVMRLILRCSSDSSVQVRDSALGLIGKCIDLRPALEETTILSILQRVTDSGVGVRKRAIKLLKDIYLRNKDKDVRSLIADALLHRVIDLDEGVQELARQTIEEVWMSPFYLSASSDEVTVEYRLAVADHVALMVKTIQRSPGVSTVLDKVLQNMLSSNSKFTVANFKVCKAFVASMFDTIVDNSGAGVTDRVEARDSLQLLMTFAKANAKLFATEQIQLLQPYITDLKTDNDLAIFRCVVVIFRHVFPQLLAVHSKFLNEVRATLMPSVSRINRALLDDVFACLWIISDVLESTDHLARLLSSTLGNISKHKGLDLSAPKNADHARKLNRVLIIAGMCGKHCDLDSQADTLRKAFPGWKGTSVSRLMVDTFASFASPSQPVEVRKSALDAIGLVCQSWPKNFSSANIYTTFMQAFEDRIEVLESVIMRSFKEFFISEEKRSDPDAETAVGASGDKPATLGVMGGSQHDGVAIDIYQRFMSDITRIALASQDEHALIATEILVSINRQGLNHPKECGPTFVALETSQNTRIADIAFQQHRSLHQKHETILEKESMRAVQAAFTYQRDVVNDTRGATTEPFKAKLHLLMEVLNISKVKTRKRFYESLCARIDFDPAKLDTSRDRIAHVEYSRFMIENMAFFEYTTIDELLGAITAMEKVVTGTGAIIAHALETEMKPLLTETKEALVVDGIEIPSVGALVVDSTRLRQLTAASMIIYSLWEARTHLRRSYGLMNNRKETKGKVNTKDLNRAPARSPGVTGDRFWEEINSTMGGLSSQESMVVQCKAFVELLTLDKDFKIAADGEDDAAANGRLTTPSEDEGEGTPGPHSGSGRGRKRKAPGNTPGGRKKRARSISMTRGKKERRSSVDDEDEGDDWV